MVVLGFVSPDVPQSTPKQASRGYLYGIAHLARRGSCARLAKLEESTGAAGLHALSPTSALEMMLRQVRHIHILGNELGCHLSTSVRARMQIWYGSPRSLTLFSSIITRFKTLSSFEYCGASGQAAKAVREDVWRTFREYRVILSYASTLLNQPLTSCAC